MGIDAEALQEVAFAVNDPRSKYMRASRLIDRVMAASCSPTEYRILRFVLDRTLAYGKEYESIPESHFVYGVWTRDGQLLHPPVNIAKAALYRNIKSLIAKKMLIKKTDRATHTVYYMLELNFDFANVAKGIDMVGRLNVSKKRQGNQSQSLKDTSSSLKETTRSLKETSYITEDTNKGFKLARPKAAQRDPKGLQSHTIQEAISASQAKSSVARQRRKAKGNMSGLLKTYEDQFRETYEDDPYVPPTDKSWVAFCRAMNRAKIEDPTDFVQWLVREYIAVAKSKFKFLLRENNHPQLPFITSKIATFVLAYADASDPNRDVDRRIRKKLTDKNDAVEKNELEQLREKVTVLERQNTELKTGRGSNAEVEASIVKRAVIKRKRVSRAILHRPKSHKEFGEW